WRNGFTVPLRLSLADRLEVLRHPRWLWGYLSGPPLTLANLAEAGRGSKAEVLGKWVNTELCNPAQSYDDLRRLRESWPGRLLVKGTLTPEDAELAVACGVDGVIVSNHGGRQLDFAPPATVLVGLFEQALAAEHALEARALRRGDLLAAHGHRLDLVLPQHGDAVDVADEPVAGTNLDPADPDGDVHLTASRRRGAAWGEPACKEVEPERPEPLEVAHEAVHDDCDRAGPHGIGPGQLAEVRPLARTVRDEHCSRFALGERPQHRRDGALVAARRHRASRERAASHQPMDARIEDPPLAGGIADT